MPSKGLEHKRELVKRRKAFQESGHKRKHKPIKKNPKRGPGHGKLERTLDRVKKENERRSDDKKLRAQLRGTVGEIVARIDKAGETILWIRNENGGLDRQVRTRTNA